MLVQSALCFLQRIGKKQTRLQFQHPNYVCFGAQNAKYVPVKEFIKIACFPYGQLPSVDVDKHHDG